MLWVDGTDGFILEEMRWLWVNWFVLEIAGVDDENKLTKYAFGQCP